MNTPNLRRTLELRLLLVTSVLYLVLLWLAYEGQTKHFKGIAEKIENGQVGADDDSEKLLNVNNLETKEELEPFLEGAYDGDEKEILIDRLFSRAKASSLNSLKDFLSIQFTEAELRAYKLSPESYLGKKLMVQDTTEYVPRHLLGFEPISMYPKKTVESIVSGATFSITGTVFIPRKQGHFGTDDLAYYENSKGISVVLKGSVNDSTTTDEKGRFRFDNLPQKGIYYVGPSLFAPCVLEHKIKNCTFEIKGRPERFAKVQNADTAEVNVDFFGEHLAGLDRYKLAQISGPFIVRTPNDYRSAIRNYGIFLYLICIYALHFLWRKGVEIQGKFPFVKLGATSHAADPFLLPLFHFLTGIGIVLMIGLRDPLRQEMLFSTFVAGVALGTLLFWVMSAMPIQAYFRPQYKKIWSLQAQGGLRVWSPAILSFLLLLLLLIMGDGPGGTRVNLWGFQPSELIKIGVVFFLAAYFSIRWEELQNNSSQGELLTKRWVPSFLKRWATTNPLFQKIPGIRYLIPIVLVMGGAIVLFGIMKDMGPAMIMVFTFLIMYAVVRQKYLALLMGVVVYVLGLYVVTLFPTKLGTFYTRIAMMASPWDNFEIGGEHLATGFWALSSGGWFGMGLGLGTPEVIPAAHTDMVLAGLGEGLGFVGLSLVISLLFLLFWRGIIVAKRAIHAGMYGHFLALGLSLLLGLEVTLILGGILGLIPLSGVVTPFISSGKTSMLANAMILGVLANISHETYKYRLQNPNALRYSNVWADKFKNGYKIMNWVSTGVFTLFILNLFWIQGWAGDTYIVKPALVKMEDGNRRFQQNPRIGLLLEKFARGTIRDRNGVPLAASDCKVFRDYAKQDSTILTASFDVDLDRDCANPKKRIYPFREHTFYILGDYNTKLRSQNPKATYLEYEMETSAALSGLTNWKGFHKRKPIFNTKEDKALNKATTERDLYDYRELIPLLRAQDRYPYFGEAGRLATRQRDLTITTDIRLQVEAARILEAHTPKGKRSALVVIDPASGGVLANVTYPLPTDIFINPKKADSTAQLDYSTHGNYPPGSTFKMVTAIAAFRKENNEEQVRKQIFECKRLPGEERVGNFVRGYGRRPIRDASGHAAHGRVNIHRGMVVSCNAYFAQLGALYVRENAMLSTINQFSAIRVCDPQTGMGNCGKLTPNERLRILRASLPQVSFGQGSLVVAPLGIAQVAATIANKGKTTTPFWIIEDNVAENSQRAVLSPRNSNQIAHSLRGVVSDAEGTARQAFAGFVVEVAGKTGTAENYRGKQKLEEHAWFAGFAPYGQARQIAFAIIIENSGGGGKIAAPAARDLIQKAKELKIID